jgi:L-lactate dehydrogenase complex protein LldG
VREAPDPGLPLSWPGAPGSGADGNVASFSEALADAAGSVSRAGPNAVAAQVEWVAREVGARTAVVAADTVEFAAAIDAGLEAAGVSVERPSAERWREAAAAADLGVTSATIGVAATGSVLVVPGEGSPRVASLLPSAHLVILPVHRIVGGLDQALEAVAHAASTASSAVLVTGPSRTADIEMISVLGVHGPRRLHVLLVDAVDNPEGLRPPR